MACSLADHTTLEQVTRIAFPAPGTNDYPRPATALAFDAIAELLWVGNDRVGFALRCGPSACF